MSNLVKGIILVVVVLAIGVGLVVWKNATVGHAQSFNSITEAEIQVLLADVAKNNPMTLKRLKETPEMKKQQLDSLRQLLAFASQAQRDGIAAETANKQELDSIRAEVIAVTYDREINKDQGPMPPFGFISEEQVNAYWADTSAPAAAGGFMSMLGLGAPAETRTHEQEFEDFLSAKIEIMKAGNPEMEDKEISEEERTAARDVFAKIRIYENEFEQKAKAGELDKAFVDKAYLQVKLQQAQFLARLYSQKVADQMKVSEEEVDRYIAENPEFDTAPKRAKAQEILDRAKAGEDFATLANEFSEDPGNKGPDGQPQGGIYKDVPKGQMVAPFEQAALATSAGQVHGELVESDFGFHIVKLERALGPSPNKSDAPAAPGAPPAKQGDTYDVRHILISTGHKDPDQPNARAMPAKDFVRNKLESEKEKKMLDEIVAANNVQVPTDFEVPEVTEEQLQQARQKQQAQMQQQMQPPGGGPPPGVEVKPAPKPDAKKK